MLELKSVSKKYGVTRALKDVSLTLPQGQIVGLFGENGAGKTTLMKCILGLLSHGGTITLDGASINEKNIERLSFATCEHSFFELPMNKPLRAFSAGMKNQFEVVMALSQGADYILMDEPFAGNDVFNREDFYKVLLGILEEHETVLLSTHLLEEVQHFISRAVLIRKGELVGDCTIEELEEQGKDLMTYVKETYCYQGDRVSRVLCDVNDEEG